MKADSSKQSPANTPLQTAFTLLLGLLLGVALIKFGNPAIFESKIGTPDTLDEVLLETWPFSWAYLALAPVAILGFCVARWKLLRPKWLFLMPLIWLAWQFISATKTVQPDLTTATLKHFTACVVLFYLGALCLARIPNTALLWIGVMIAFIFVIREGFSQRFTREAERQYFLSIDWDNPPPELREKFSEEQLRVFRSAEFREKRLKSDRISGPLFYPNTLAGAILLFLPITLGVTWQYGQRLRPSIRWLGILLLSGSALMCLYWSGSKSGWLLTLALGLIAVIRSQVPKQFKLCVVALALLLGLGGFAVKFAGFFQKGATSVVARTEYWRAAVKTFAANPLFGTGPGTFAIPYAKIKPPEAEMARLCHNDYLEQASDSGAVGAITFAVFIFGTFFVLYRERNPDFLSFSIILGLSGLFLQSFLEFNLYIPALAWSGFLFLGLLWGKNTDYSKS